MHIMLQRERCLPRDTPQWWLCFVESAPGVQVCRKGTAWAEAPEATEAQPSSHPEQFPAASSRAEFLIPSVWLSKMSGSIRFNLQKKITWFWIECHLQALLFLLLWRLFTPQDSLVLLITLLQTFIIALFFSPPTHTLPCYIWVQITVLI